MKILLGVLGAVAFVSIGHAEVRLDNANFSCAYEDVTSSGNEKAVELASDVENVSKVFNCDAVKKNIFSRFDTMMCNMTLDCRNGILKDQKASKEVDKVINEAFSKDFAKNILMKASESMERFDVLKKFAQKKYDDKLGKNCEDRFAKKDSKGGSCNLKAAEEVFNEYQKNCSEGSKGCFKSQPTSGVMSYNSFQIKEKDPKVLLMADYFNYRVDNKFQSEMDNDAKDVEALAVLVSSDEFKKASLDEKSDMFINKIGIDRGYLKDPVLGFDFGLIGKDRSSFKRSLKFKEMMALYTAKDISKESFTKSFENYRQKRAQGILNAGKICEQMPTLNSICKDMASLAQGKIVPKNAIDVEALSSRDIKDEKGLGQLKSMLKGKFDEQDYEVLLNAKRCLSFAIDAKAKMGTYPEKIAALHDDFDFSGGTKSNSATTFGIIDNSVGSVRNYNLSSDEFHGPSQYAGSLDDRDLAGSGSRAINSEGVAAAGSSGAGSMGHEEGTSLADNFGQGGYQTASTPFQQTSSFVPYSDQTLAENNGTKEKRSGEGESSGSNAATDDKISDLAKKLAAAEERMEKMKADTEAANLDREKQKAIDRDNALIQDLKTQISDLKASKKAATAVVEAAAPVNYGPSTNDYMGPVNYPSIGSGSYRNNDSASNTRPYDYGTAASAETGIGGAVPRSNRLSNEAGLAILSASSSSGGESRANSDNSGMTILDGMSSEKVAQTISSRIIELKGTPFLIEEGGLVKEIIPVMKDGKVVLDDNGKPTFEKIIKGRVGKVKVVPAKRSIADVRMDDANAVKVQAARATYSDFLKNVSGKALDGK